MRKGDGGKKEAVGIAGAGSPMSKEGGRPIGRSYEKDSTVS